MIHPPLRNTSAKPTLGKPKIHFIPSLFPIDIATKNDFFEGFLCPYKISGAEAIHTLA
jgi:hypothetical protein